MGAVYQVRLPRWKGEWYMPLFYLDSDYYARVLCKIQDGGLQSRNVIDTRVLALREDYNATTMAIAYTYMF